LFALLLRTVWILIFSMANITMRFSARRAKSTGISASSQKAAQTLARGEFILWAGLG